MSFGFTLDMHEVRQAIHEGIVALEQSAEAGILRMAEMAAREAREKHPYTDRTGDLTASTQALPGPGRYEAQVIAAETYASHVEEREGFQFLAPAVERQAEPPRVAELERDIALVVSAALNRR